MYYTEISVMSTATQDLQYSSQDACLRTICQSASIKFGFKCSADSSYLLPQVCLYVSDVGENRIIFNFINYAPGTYEIKSIGYHDDGLLGAAVKLGNIAGRETQSRNHDVHITTDSDQSKRAGSHSGIVPDASASNHDDPGKFASADGQSESVVNIFDLQNNHEFLDMIYALTDGSLYITLYILELETHSHRRCINDALPMIV